ncbi:hypothetical protein [Jannaschia aquimarina]|uniref:Lipoprotein n=1 Tax=Jannaschia aquimarina TaxID=935700 RepID=A0A0D1CS40_9RHOB|nr:hypothetical protein [Jannaschia aquimarina]KIT17617.1 hypothetical protein jaqu_05080 [Jannaschia aquimarina]SNS80725.1 hypothetical protein SAMN05421775_102373 [Jannaschia aquimarina]
MMRAILTGLSALILSGCVQSTSTNGFDAATSQVALQRMRFAAEAVCLNNRTRASQDRAARRLAFPVRERQDGAITYVNPGTLTFLRLGPSPVQALNTADGRRTFGGGHGCSVGSPAVGLAAANRVVGELLAPRLLEGDPRVASPLGAGSNAADGAGVFFDDLAVTVPIAQTTITDSEGRGQRFTHPVILILHERAR